METYMGRIHGRINGTYTGKDWETRGKTRAQLWRENDVGRFSGYADWELLNWGFFATIFTASSSINLLVITSMAQVSLQFKAAVIKTEHGPMMWVLDIAIQFRVVVELHYIQARQDEIYCCHDAPIYFSTLGFPKALTFPLSPRP